MNARTKSWACALIVLLCLGTWAAVVPYVKHLDPSGDHSSFSRLSIPAGKAVVFDHMQFTSRAVTIRLMYTTSGSGIDNITGAWDMVITNPALGQLTVTPAPIRLFAGWSISNVSSTAIYLSGLAMDDDDLYAGVGNEIDSLGLAGGALLGGVQLDSPRPVVAKVEQSEDLRTWTTDDGATIRKDTNSARLEFETAPDDPGAFFRINARGVQ
jgi:hypothetical protein